MTTIAVKPQNGNLAMPRLSEVLNSFFEPSFDNNFEWSGLSALTNTLETSDSYKLEIVAPGFEKEEVRINVDGRFMTVTAEKQNTQLNEDERYTRREYSHTSFKRTFTLPETVNAQNISAEYKNGILNITLPKVEEAKRCSIEVKVN